MTIERFYCICNVKHFVLAAQGDEDENTMHTSYDPDKDQGNLDGNPLMVPLDDGIGPTQEEITNKWFG